jgi:hypothetical protein
MYIETTLEGLNEFIKTAFKEEAIPHLRLRVEVQAPDPRIIARIYPADLAVALRGIYDEVYETVKASGKVAGIKHYREKTNEGLKEGRDFVERWFGNLPLTQTGRD